MGAGSLSPKGRRNTVTSPLGKVLIETNQNPDVSRELGK